MTLCFLTAMPALTIAASAAWAQKPDELPLPVGSPVSIQPGQPYEPLTATGKAKLALKNSFGTRALVNRAALAGLNHLTDSPEEWENSADGYPVRLASRMGRLWVRNAVQLSADVAFKTEPRYDRCNCDGFLPRTGHALKRVLVSKKDNGGEMISVSRLAGAYVTPMITDQWYPSRLNTWGHKFESGTWFLGWRGVNNMLKEFWPEIKRKTLRRRNNE
jgi:hypothetical protein